MYKVYIAASFPRLEEAAGLAAELKKKFTNVEIISRWHEADKHITDHYSDDEANQMRLIDSAIRDLDDVWSADVLIQFIGDKQTFGGRHSELGIMLGKIKSGHGTGCKIILIGCKEEQVFHWHPYVRLVDNANDLLNNLIKESKRNAEF